MADLGDQLEALAGRLNLVAADLVPELRSAIRDAVKPVSQHIKDELRPRLPDRYAEVLESELSLTISVRGAGGDPGVSLKATTRGAAQRKLKRLDSGILGHPLWGHRKHWYTQEVKSWFTEPAKDKFPEVRAAIEDAMSRIIEKA